MARTAVHRLVAVALAGIAGAGVYWTVANLLLAGSVALTWGVSAMILLRIWRLYPDYLTGDGWGDGRWVGLGVGVLGITTFEGLRALPVSTGYWLGTVLFVLGIYALGYMCATIAELERHSNRSEKHAEDAAATPPGKR